MKKLVVDKIVDYNYFLRDKDEKIYNLNIEFYDLESSVETGDYIYINEELLKEENVSFSFGPLSGEYGRKLTSSSDKDIVVLISNNEKLYLKRYYG